MAWNLNNVFYCSYYLCPKLLWPTLVRNTFDPILIVNAATNAAIPNAISATNKTAHHPHRRHRQHRHRSSSNSFSIESAGPKQYRRHLKPHSIHRYVHRQPPATLTATCPLATLRPIRSHRLSPVVRTSAIRCHTIKWNTAATVLANHNRSKCRCRRSTL